jgi:hypothetical protein
MHTDCLDERIVVACPKGGLHVRVAYMTGTAEEKIRSNFKLNPISKGKQKLASVS